LTEEIGDKMKIETILNKIEFLYHLTDRRNLEFILKNKSLFSTNVLAEMAGTENKDLVFEKRFNHETLKIGDCQVFIRDQRPLNAALDKCLTDGWTRSQYIHLLNSKAFFWPNLNRLERHYKRYIDENPVILRVRLKEILEINGHIELCHLNSGATRPLGSLGGFAPERGPNTFLSLELFDKPVEKIAEIVFDGRVELPLEIWISNAPHGPWEKCDLSTV
jgi:hypothetical protein